ncbi:alpha/beta hydrolase fold-domain-containing protein [Lasiosphaeria miniovina]|uniref:Alpha/beta hydrolase fold-domain-containing protein n=1 Tax=Lasiosphaeria miniovina TaxID=1954250 RepID=A0AA40A4T4_9PEZI|nr:alpha/beta hydrolase fold-domain-containing protein [Lasiosphaeria miniovina]KAK0709292.1 alpha/beta hydrolase fold-domain-containing protein [Lasiosphaeria miniovina]
MPSHTTTTGTTTNMPSHTITTGTTRPIYQPLHPSARPLLDPEYVAFHDAHLQYILPDDRKPWDGSARAGHGGAMPPTESPPVPVGRVLDIHSIAGRYDVRIFTPPPLPSGSGGAPWPVFLWFHGGGWCVGDVSHNNDACALICTRARCVVVAVGYRLAPEHVFPAAIDDAAHALRWARHAHGLAAHLGSGEALDPSRVAVGGLSAGGQLAASLAFEEGGEDLAFALLVVPVVDSTATVGTTWARNADAPWLTPKRMAWYRDMYFRGKDEEDRRHWRASPNFAPAALLARSPRTWIAVAERDLLAPEAEGYAEQLAAAWDGEGVKDREVVVKVYQGSTHSILALNGEFSTAALFAWFCGVPCES